MESCQYAKAIFQVACCSWFVKCWEQGNKREKRGKMKEKCRLYNLQMCQQIIQDSRHS